MKTWAGQAARADAIPAQPGGAAFAHDVLEGLSNPQKSVPCTWLYDRQGSELFEQITATPEYYPTRTEIEILGRCATQIGALAGPRACLIELGSGSSRKTRLLLSALDAPCGYVPVDISAQFLEESVRFLRTCFPRLRIHPLVADFNRLGALPPGIDAGLRRLVFFPGSTIGNLTPDAAVDLLRQVAQLAGAGGLLVLGADATQDPAWLLPAYDDAQGVTAAFNKNLLVRMNRELDADFDLDAFDHAARYDAIRRRVEMHLVSRCQQWVRVAGQRFHFEQGESIHTENSYKFGFGPIREMAARAGWAQRQIWTDVDTRFGVHLFECVE